MSARWPQVAALGLAQTVAWASSTYLPAVLAQPLAADLGFAPTRVFAAFSAALLLMAVLGPAVGRAIDRHGGQGVLCASNLVLAAGLGLLGCIDGSTGLFTAWLLIGAGMALGLYDAAFAALVREHGVGARLSITGITLFAGFASTIGWPLTAWLSARWGWRPACFTWAVMHLLLALPLNWRFVPSARQLAARPAGEGGATAAAESDAGRRRNVVALLVFGAATAFVTSAMAAHLPGLLIAFGLPAAAAIGAAALVGPAQVAARVGELLAARQLRTDPLAVARLATALYPVGALLLVLLGGTAGAAAFALFYGAGNGMITIAKGMLPLHLFGPAGYGLLQGRLAVAQRLTQAAAPFAFALLLQSAGAGVALAVSAALALVGLGALFALRSPPAGEPVI